MEVIWALKHSHIGDAFFDADAAQFLLEELRAGFWQEWQHQKMDNLIQGEQAQDRSSEYPGTESGTCGKQDVNSDLIHPLGHAVGPEWVKSLPTTGFPPAVKLEINCTITSLEEIERLNEETSVKVKLSNGTCFDVDFVISAIGVNPATDWVPSSILKATDEGIKVDAGMQSSILGIYAAGDACTYSSDSPHWFQMRLWTQVMTGALEAVSLPCCLSR